MKCPKCGYISFDHNETCPKCRKDITSERDKMKLPTYRAKPPFLLGSLIAEPEETDTDLHMGHPGESSLFEPSFEENAPLGPQPIELSGLSPQATGPEMPKERSSTDPSLEEAREEFTIDLEDPAFQDPEADVWQAEGAIDNGILLEPDLSSIEGDDIEKSVDSESVEIEGDIDFIHLDDLIKGESETSPDEGDRKEDEDKSS